MGQKLAVDVVLLPSEEIVDKAIELNKELIKKFDKKIILNKENCLPHISLAMGCINENDLPAIEKILEEIAKQFPLLNLTLVNAYSEQSGFAGFEKNSRPLVSARYLCGETS